MELRLHSNHRRQFDTSEKRQYKLPKNMRFTCIHITSDECCLLFYLRWLQVQTLFNLYLSYFIQWWRGSQKPSKPLDYQMGEQISCKYIRIWKIQQNQSWLHVRRFVFLNTGQDSQRNSLKDGDSLSTHTCAQAKSTHAQTSNTCINAHKAPFMSLLCHTAACWG